MTAMTAVAGYEQAMADTLLRLAGNRAGRDRAGNVVVTLGEGEPVRLATCPMDEAGFVVGNVRDDGFVTLRRVGSGPRLFDQSHEGHRVTVWGRNGPVPAVVAIPSAHLQRAGDRPAEPFSVDDAYLELGAETAADVASLGIELVNPVALEKAPHRYGPDLDRLAGPEAGQRSSCAALLAAAREVDDPIGTVIVAFTVESRMGHRGFRSLVAERGPFRETILVDYRLPERLVSDRLGTVDRLAVPTAYDGWAVETVSLANVRRLSERLASWMQGAER